MYDYKVEILRAGQPRPYADTVHEYRVTATYTPTWGKDRTPQPWCPYRVDKPGDKERQLKWAKAVVKAICQDFREVGDEDGREGMDAHFYPTLQSISVDEKAGIVRAIIVTPFTD